MSASGPRRGFAPLARTHQRGFAVGIPTYASWVNPTEAHFAPLRPGQLQPPQPHRADPRPSPLFVPAQAHARHPDVLAAQCARICSEKGIRWGQRLTKATA
jgi:hypothetical protein